MDKSNRRSRRRRGGWNRSKNGAAQTRNDSRKSGGFRFIPHENIEARQRKEKAIQELKRREVICPVCGQQIPDISSALADKKDGKPVHFDCVLQKLSETERVGENERLSYIGQGRFAVLHFENPRDQRHFSIRKIIEWEERDKKFDWRSELSGLYSQVE